MNAKATLVLMVLFLVSGSFALFDPFQWKEKKEESEERESHVAWIKGKTLERLVIGTGPTAVVASCALPEGCPPDGSADWKLEAPVQDAGDSSSLGSLASAVLNLTHLEKLDFEGKPDPAEFGLGPQAKRLEIRVKGEAEPYVLEVGGATAAGPNLYLWSSREPHRLYVVASFFGQMLDKDLFHWRNKRLFPDAQTETVTSLQWKGKSALSAAKKDGSWSILSPVEAPGNHILLEGLASTLVYASAKSIFSDQRTSPEARKVLAGKPSLELQFESEGKKNLLRLFPHQGKGRPGAEYVAAVEGATGPLFLVEGVPFDRFLKPLLEYRNRRLFPGRDRGSVEEISLEFPREKKALSLRFEEGAWKHASGETPAEELSQDRIKAILGALVDTEATAFLPSSSQGARLLATQPADVIVTLRGGGQENKAKFLVLERKSALTEGLTPREVRSYGEDLLKALPIRLQDLYASNNKTVIPEPRKEENGHDHSHEHGHGHGGGGDQNLHHHHGHGH